jgi:hypothetical protein
MPDITEKDKEKGILLLRLGLIAFAAWILMLTQARIDKDTGVPGGNFSYLASVGTVATIWFVGAAKRPFSGLRS